MWSSLVYTRLSANNQRQALYTPSTFYGHYTTVWELSCLHYAKQWLALQLYKGTWRIVYCCLADWCAYLCILSETSAWRGKNKLKNIHIHVWLAGEASLCLHVLSFLRVSQPIFYCSPLWYFTFSLLESPQRWDKMWIPVRFSMRASSYGFHRYSRAYTLEKGANWDP